MDAVPRHDEISIATVKRRKLKVFNFIRASIDDYLVPSSLDGAYERRGIPDSRR